MKTTKQLVDEDWERIRYSEQGIIDLEREQIEKELLVEMIKEQYNKKHGKVILGQPRKANKFAHHGRVLTGKGKLPRIIKNYIQHFCTGI